MVKNIIKIKNKNEIVNHIFSYYLDKLKKEDKENDIYLLSLSPENQIKINVGNESVGLDLIMINGKEKINYYLFDGIDLIKCARNNNNDFKIDEIFLLFLKYQKISDEKIDEIQYNLKLVNDDIIKKRNI